jgi:hypothetical protein
MPSSSPSTRPDIGSRHTLRRRRGAAHLQRPDGTQADGATSGHPCDPGQDAGAGTVAGGCLGSLLVQLDARPVDPVPRDAGESPFIQSTRHIGGHTRQDDHEASAYWALPIALGVVPILAGFDKFTNLLVDWERCLSPLAVRLLPVSPAVFMRAAGVIEVVVGAGIPFGYARVFGWIAMTWLATW